MENNYGNNSNSHQLKFPRNNNTFHGMQHYLQLLQVVEIVSIKCVRIATLTFQGHVTPSVTWSFFPRYEVSYRCSIDTNPLSWALCEIWSLKHIWVATLTFRVTWRHLSRDRSIGRGPFPIGVPLVLTFYRQRISRYSGSGNGNNGPRVKRALIKRVCR